MTITQEQALRLLDQEREFQHLRTGYPDENLDAIRDYIEKRWPYMACTQCGAIQRIPIENERVQIYESSLAIGLSESEARGTAWPVGL